MGGLMQRFFAVVLLLATSAVGAGSLLTDARGEEATPATRTRTLRRNLPEPGSTGTFDFEGYVLRDGAPYGRVRLSALASAQGTWQVRDAIQPLKPSADRVLATAELDARLRTRSGTYMRRGSRGFLSAELSVREGGGYRIEHQTADYENRLDIDGAGALSTLSGAILLLRLLPPGPGVYEVPDLDPNPSPGDPYIAPARLEVHRVAPWRVGGGARPAWIVSYTRGTQTLRLALDAKTRNLLGVTFIGLPFQFVPKGSGSVGLQESVASDLMTPVEHAVARTRAVRARLPRPRRGFDVRAEVRLGANRVGTARLRADPACHACRAVWSVHESQVLRTGASTVEGQTTGVLDRDLTLLRGERLDRRPSGTFRATYERVAGGIRTVTGAERENVTLLDAAEDASTGLMPVLLFLRSVPRTPAHYVLPGWDPRSATTPKAGSGAFAFRAADVHIEVRGTVPFELDGVRRHTLQASCTLRNGRRYDLYLDARSRDFVALLGQMPKTSIVASASIGQRADWYDAIEGKPQSARQAFIKFGRGYHLPREDLLKAAFHWPSLVKQALAAGRYAEGTPPEQIQKDWIAVFVGMSKHRTPGDCDDLLFQILMTSREVTHADGSVSLHTLPVYGGHTYRMAERDGRWWIVAID